MAKLSYLKHIPLIFLFLFFSCEKNDDIIDNTQNPSFNINLSEISTLKINTDTLTQFVVVSSDTFLTTKINVKINSLNNISAFSFKITGPSSSSSLDFEEISAFTKETVNNNKNYKFDLPLKILKNELGIYQIEIHSIDESNNSSNAIIASITVVRITNKPPVIESVTAPDTVTVLNDYKLIRLSVKVSDADGLSDISAVVFNSFKPDNTPASGNPFSMFDDGNTNGTSGDATADDGIYSLIIQLQPTAQKGTYRFEFIAYDKTDEKSNTIIHYIVVK
jgi:hypothetical protein